MAAITAPDAAILSPFCVAFSPTARLASRSASRTGSIVTGHSTPELLTPSGILFRTETALSLAAADAILPPNFSPVPSNTPATTKPSFLS